MFGSGFESQVPRGEGFEVFGRLPCNDVHGASREVWPRVQRVGRVGQHQNRVHVQEKFDGSAAPALPVNRMPPSASTVMPLKKETDGGTSRWLMPCLRAPRVISSRPAGDALCAEPAPYFAWLPATLVVPVRASCLPEESATTVAISRAGVGEQRMARPKVGLPGTFTVSATLIRSELARPGRARHGRRHRRPYR